MRELLDGFAEKTIDGDFEFERDLDRSLEGTGGASVLIHDIVLRNVYNFISEYISGIP